MVLGLSLGGTLYVILGVVTFALVVFFAYLVMVKGAGRGKESGGGHQGPPPQT
ncbi:hypothetical protein [Rubrivirga sp.]|uniref:hypothetical protein n=1 Tax=Rubrivirga sp. TaxID=1885344 RepID=UPI003B5224F4